MQVDTHALAAMLLKLPNADGVVVHLNDDDGGTLAVVVQGFRLRSCATDGCKQFFVAIRGQVRCSKACGQRARSAAFYAKNGKGKAT